ncbi:MAG: prepilin peptidase, partial [Planctomycetota bacterium]
MTDYVDYLARFERIILAFEVLGVAVVGLLWGSFLNVCIYRLPIYRLIFYPLYSFCPTCGKPIRWYDNVPVLSYLLLRGRCRSCAATISPRYVLVELLTAVVVVAAFLKLTVVDGEPLAFLAVQCAILSALIVATVTDFEHTIIPDEISVGGALLAPLVSFAYPLMHRTVWLQGSPHWNALVVSLFSLAVCAALIYAIGFLGKLL